LKRLSPARRGKKYPTTLLPGLYFIVQPSGAKSWAVRYRSAGRPRKHTLGPYPRLDLKAARDLARTALRAAAEGRDPASEKIEARAATPNSIEHVVEDFLERHVRPNYRPRSMKETERLLRVHVVSSWRNRAIGTITRRDVRELLEKIKTGGAPIVANQVHSVTRGMFNWCIGNEIVAASPITGLKAPSKATSRDRVLSDEELRLVWKAADNAGTVYAALVRLLILTGQRRGEVAGMRWDELDLDNRIWKLPGERTKNSRPHDVPLSKEALAIIKALPRISDEYVLSLRPQAPIRGFQEGKEALDALLPDLPPWVLHDLRRTVATGMAKLGISLPVIEKVLNHASGSFAGIVGIYQRHDYADEKRKALDMWASHVSELVATDSAKGRARKSTVPNGTVEKRCRDD
jgi:integrase